MNNTGNHADLFEPQLLARTVGDSCTQYTMVCLTGREMERTTVLHAGYWHTQGDYTIANRAIMWITRKYGLVFTKADVDKFISMREDV